MKYRLSIIFLISLLFVSFSFNCLYYDAMIRAEKINKIDCEMYRKFIEIAYSNRTEG